MLEVASADTWESSMLDASKPDGSFKLVLPREKGHKYEVEHRDGRRYTGCPGARRFHGLLGAGHEGQAALAIWRST